MVDNMISPSGMYYKPKHCKMLTSIPTNQIHDDIVKIFSTEQDRRTTFMDSISTKPCVRFVNRATLFEDIIELYGDDTIAVEYPMSIKFVGEKAIDCGGVSRDMISGFWEMAYRNIFDGSSLLTPTIEPHTNAIAQLPSVGRFLSHAFLCTGFLPTRVAFPTLAGMLLGPGVKIDSPILLEALADYLSEVDRGVLKEALTISRAQMCNSFPKYLKESLLTILSAYGCRQIPTPCNLQQMLLQVAKFVFQSMPMLAIVEINSGIPEVHKPFWASKTLDDLYSIYKCLSVTPSKVLALLNEPLFASRAEAVVYGYLRQFIGNMSLEQVRIFLRFVTGSSVCIADKLEVEFNGLTGLARRPIAHTCSNCLELSAAYTSYPEFEREFQLILSNETFTWVMDAI